MAFNQGTQYRRVPTAGTRVLIKRGRKTMNGNNVGYPNELLRALRQGHQVTALSNDNSQSMNTGVLTAFQVNGVPLNLGTLSLPVRDLYRALSA